MTEDTIEGLPTLHDAAQHDNSRAIKQLTAKGAEVNLPNKFGQSPLHVAAGAGAHGAIEALLKAGADVGARDLRGRTPLMFAQDMKTVKLLQRHGADINAKDNTGQTLLHHWAYTGGQIVVGNNERIGRLIDAGADVNARDRNLETPLHKVAAGFGDADTCRALLAKGADVSLRDNRLLSALDVARSGGSAELCAALSEAVASRRLR
ncbi:MAG: ankyrin repeat domain-containing protein [Planctomycetia bacterium]|nr:ankyrin repeat domain-containing protein [Planctomycetia bacterium]